MNTYTELLNAVTSYAGQDGNLEFTDMVPLFISLGEADVYRNLRHDRMIKNIAINSVIPPYLIPDDCLEMVAVLQGYSQCEFVTSDFILSKPATATDPTVWSILGNELIFDGTPTSNTAISYFSKPVELAQAANPMFVQNPDLFLYAALSHAMIFLRDEVRQGIWDGLFRQKLQEIMGAAWSARLPKQQLLVMRTV